MDPICGSKQHKQRLALMMHACSKMRDYRLEFANSIVPREFSKAALLSKVGRPDFFAATKIPLRIKSSMLTSKNIRHCSNKLKISIGCSHTIRTTTSTGGAIKSTFIFTETAALKSTIDAPVSDNMSTRSAICANSMATQSLNSRKMNMECIRFESVSRSSTQGGVPLDLE